MTKYPENKKEVIENINAWLTALRSGEYEQGKETMCTLDGKYCCLGVMNKIFDLSVDGYAPTPEDFRVVFGHKIVNAPFVRLQITANIRIYGEYVSTYNDLKDKNFLEIADMLEEVLLPWAEEVYQ